MQNKTKFRRLDSHYEMNHNPPGMPSNALIFIGNIQATAKMKLNVIYKLQPCNLVKCIQKKRFRKNNEHLIWFSSITNYGHYTNSNSCFRLKTQIQSIISHFSVCAERTQKYLSLPSEIPRHAVRNMDIPHFIIPGMTWRMSTPPLATVSMWCLGQETCFISQRAQGILLVCVG